MSRLQPRPTKLKGSSSWVGYYRSCAIAEYVEQSKARSGLVHYRHELRSCTNYAEASATSANAPPWHRLSACAGIIITTTT